jgi:hypothetical protein
VLTLCCRRPGMMLTGVRLGVVIASHFGVDNTASAQAKDRSKMYISMPNILITSARFPNCANAGSAYGNRTEDACAVPITIERRITELDVQMQAYKNSKMVTLGTPGNLGESFFPVNRTYP